MTLTSSNVRVGVSGEVSVAALATALPATAAAALTGFTGSGYISEDGVVENPEVNRESITAWQNATVVREVVTEAKLSYEFTLIETTKGNVELYYGATVTQTVTEGSYTISPAATAGRKAWVIDVIDGANILRKCIAEGELFKGEGVTFASGEAIAYPCILVAYTNPIVHDTALKS